MTTAADRIFTYADANLRGGYAYTIKCLNMRKYDLALTRDGNNHMQARVIDHRGRTVHDETFGRLFDFQNFINNFRQFPAIYDSAPIAYDPRLQHAVEEWCEQNCEERVDALNGTVDHYYRCNSGNSYRVEVSYPFDDREAFVAFKNSSGVAIWDGYNCSIEELLESVELFNQHIRVLEVLYSD